MKKLRISFVFPLVVLFLIIYLPSFCFGAKSKVLITATVESFGTYSYEGSINAKINQTGSTEIGKITVNGIYNGPYPWYMRIYTDNKNYQGVAGSSGKKIADGLISKDGLYSIRLLVNCPNYDSAFLRIPDINNPDYKTYMPSSFVGEETHNERIIMGIDPRNANWVSGPDKILFTDDDDPKGNTTWPTPFDLQFKVESDNSTVQGEYETDLYIEIVPAP